MTERPDPVTVAVPRRVWLPFAIGGTLMLLLLGAQVLMIEDQRTTTDAQLRTAVRQANANLPLVEDAQPLVEELRSQAPALRRAGVDVVALVRELRRAEPRKQLEATGDLARTLLGADAGDALRRVAELSVALTRADLPQTVQALSRVSGELLHQDRLRRLLVRSTAVLGEMRALNTVAKGTRAAELVPSLERTVRRSLAIQEQLLRTQVEALRVAQDTREAAREAERHAESLDRKLGGETSPAGTR